MNGASAVSADIHWRSEYGQGCDEWSTKVEVKLTNVPEHGEEKAKIQALVGCFCDVQAYRYEGATKEYYVVGFARNLQSIPREQNLSLKYETANGVLLKSFLVKVEGRLYVEERRDNGTEGETSLDDFVRSYERQAEEERRRYEAHEEYEDPDVIREEFEIQHMLNYTGYGTFRGDEDLYDLRRTYERQRTERRGEAIMDDEERNSSAGGSLGFSVDSDWSFHFTGR